jgi:hypothetical protein
VTRPWLDVRRDRRIIAVCFTVGALFLAKALYRGLEFTHGDFYFSLPGEYARRLNAALWNSPDMQTAVSFNHGTYLYGPTQYLTLFPIVFLSSYRSIALVLLVVYPLVLLAGWHVLRKALGAFEPEPPVMPAALFVMMFAFLPVTQALIQREFEVVALLLLVVACLLLVQGREMASGAVIAALTWFKYWPVVLLGAFVVHRRFKGLAAFAAASGVLLLTTHALFGLEYFVFGKITDIIGGLIRPLGSGEVLYPVIERGAAKSDFCRQWVFGRGTQADVRWLLCGVEDRFPRVPVKLLYFSSIATAGALFTWAALVLARQPANPVELKWRTVWELSVLTIVGATFVHAHYYYFVALLLPFGALLWRYATQSKPPGAAKMTMLAAAYLLLNAFMLPLSWMSSIVHRDAWAWYLDSGFVLVGTWLLLALVLWELATLATGASRSVAAV